VTARARDGELIRYQKRFGRFGAADDVIWENARCRLSKLSDKSVPGIIRLVSICQRVRDLTRKKSIKAFNADYSPVILR